MVQLRKVRLGYAEVGSDADVGPYADQLFYSLNSNIINNPLGARCYSGEQRAVRYPNQI